MYYPYFRGKQYELITVRECAEILSNANFIPIIEPVKEVLNGLIKTLNAIVDANGRVVLIINPQHGDLPSDTNVISDLFFNELSEWHGISVGIFLSNIITVDEVIRICQLHHERNITLIHNGFTEANELALRLSQLDNANVCHVFEDSKCGKLYQKHYRNETRILLRDGFEKRTNKNHPPIEYFSDLHVTYIDEGMDGFSDFLMVGEGFSTSGGPAYAVAIHLTFIDAEKDDAMYIHHFVSDTQNTPKNPAGKFSEALDKLIAEVERAGNQILRTAAVDEFIQLHAAGHFPGLGYVKKLSMNHHIETLAEFCTRR